MATISGGERFKAKLRETIERLGKGGVMRAGFLEGATYPDEANTPVALVALVQNYGSASQGIPPRPFFTNVVRDKSARWGDDFVHFVKNSDDDVGLALRKMGRRVADQIQQSIQETTAPPLSDATIARKGFAKPLIDTATMFNAVNFEVEDL